MDTGWSRYVAFEVRDFEQSKKTARFEIVFTEETFYEDNRATEESQEECLIRLEETKKQFKVVHEHGSWEEEISCLTDRIAGSVVIFFRVGSGYGIRVYINITYNWLGRWKYIRFDMEGSHGVFERKLR